MGAISLGTPQRRSIGMVIAFLVLVFALAFIFFGFKDIRFVWGLIAALAFAYLVD